MTPIEEWLLEKRKRATIEEEYGGLVEVVSNCCHLEDHGTAHNREERNISAHLCYFPPYILYGAESLLNWVGWEFDIMAKRTGKRNRWEYLRYGSLLGDLFNYSI